MGNFLKAAALFMLLGTTALAQQSPDAAEAKELAVYRASATKINDLVHTKLDVRFDYKKRYLYGKEWLTLKPHAYATDSLRLDAKGMDIRKVAMINANGKPADLKYTYDGMQLHIRLGKSYKAGETYTVFLDYTAKPNELKVQGSAAITDAKGLYFINPDSTEKDKPVQIWTQGETEASSAWFPTIDRTNQKTTSEISMTVPGKYVTLSNGRLAAQKKNSDGTRTDTWKMELPHSPYLFMMAVGDFRIFKDQWKGKEVSYYLEPKYAPYAKQLLGYTPEVIDFYSTKLGVDYPWNKYSQIVVRDYVSGAMENTTATLHGDYVQATPRQMLDAEYGGAEATVVHELFHQWFGDYVTAESWSNLTVNESFANFSETLWAEHKHGKDAGDEHNYGDMQQYLGSPGNEIKDLVRFHYANKEDMFDLVSYQKGGRVLNMLRHYLGEDVFFKGLNTYLKTNAFKSGEAHQLRLAFEDASGQDLNWFFNQWYFGHGHPVMHISYKWDAATKKQYVYLNQSQTEEAFILPFAVDIYVNGKKQRHQEKMTAKTDTLVYTLPAKPDLVNVDAEKILLWQKTDDKTLAEFAYQQQHAASFVDRAEAIQAAAEKQGDAVAQKILTNGLKDPYYTLRIETINTINWKDPLWAKTLPALEKIATADEKTLVQAAALKIMGETGSKQYIPVFEKALETPSYAVEGAALGALATLEPEKAFSYAQKFAGVDEQAISEAVVKIYAEHGGDNEWPYVLNSFEKAGPQGKFDMLRGFAAMLFKLNKKEYVEQGVEQVKSLAIKYKSMGADRSLSPLLQQIKQAKPEAASTVDQAIKDISEAK
ncbi:MAG: M1 family metallopeptidase [Mucilaginibacter polytrichastri]|nr:M1 family metallopeptidase [Mucilaginibacter polytrichastri]